jgi:hypothetical protein
VVTHETALAVASIPAGWRNEMVKIVTMERVETGDRRNARYKDFSPSFPAAGVRLAGPTCPMPEEAEQSGKSEVAAYEKADPYGNMGQLCGVTPVNGGYRAVICTYHSNT